MNILRENEENESEMSVFDMHTFSIYCQCSNAVDFCCLAYALCWCGGGGRPNEQCHAIMIIIMLLPYACMAGRRLFCANV